MPKPMTNKEINRRKEVAKNKSKAQGLNIEFLGGLSFRVYCPKHDCSRTLGVRRLDEYSIPVFCKKCSKYFSISFKSKLNTIKMMNDHLNGLSFSKLAESNGISKTRAYQLVMEELEKLPDNKA